MNATRLMVALLAALLFSGVATFLISRKVAARPNVAPIQQRYAATARTLDAGEAIKADSLVMIDWPVSLPIKGAFPKAADLIGRVLLYPLAAGELIVDRQLAVAGSGAGLTGRIPLGMRALSLRSDDVVGVAGFLLPGTHVDVLVTYHTGKSPEPTTATVLQDAVVLAAGHQIDPDPEGKAASVDVVTLMLDPGDADRIVLATAQGSIHFVLRNGADRGHVDLKPVGLSQLLKLESSTTVARRLARPDKVALKTYAVETVLGTKQSVASF